MGTLGQSTSCAEDDNDTSTAITSPQDESKASKSFETMIIIEAVCTAISCVGMLDYYDT